MIPLSIHFVAQRNISTCVVIVKRWSAHTSAYAEIPYVIVLWALKEFPSLSTGRTGGAKWTVRVTIVASRRSAHYHRESGNVPMRLFSRATSESRRRTYVA